jgi:hypothetical protein
VSPLDGADDDEELAELESMLAEVEGTSRKTAAAGVAASATTAAVAAGMADTHSDIDEQELADLENELDMP